MRAAAAPPRSVLLTGVWHDDNKGDAAITLGTVSLVRARWPGCRVVVSPLRGQPEAVRHLRRLAPHVEIIEPVVAAMPTEGALTRVRAALWAVRVVAAAVATVAGRPPVRLRKAVGEADAVVAVGGSNLFDTGRGFGASSVRLLQLCLPGLAATRLETPLYVLGHTLGPFNSRVGRAIARRFLAGAELVVLREPMSVAVARSLGRADAAMAPDMAFAVVPAHTARVEKLLADNALDSASFAVVAVRPAPYGGFRCDERLLRELGTALRRLVDEDTIGRVAVVAHTLGPTLAEDDRPLSRRLFEELAADLPSGTVVYVEVDLGPDELAALYGRAVMIIAERLHAVILGLRGGTPGFAISYFTHKAAGVMQAFGLANFCCPLDEVAADTIVDAARRLRSPEIRHAVRRRAAQAATELEGVLP